MLKYRVLIITETTYFVYLQLLSYTGFMKKILLLVLITGFMSVASYSQDIAIIDMNGNDVTNSNFRPWQLYPGQEIGTHFKIVNTGIYDRDISLKITNLNLPTDWSKSLCLIQCWPNNPPVNFSYSIFSGDTAAHDLIMNITAGANIADAFEYVVGVTDFANGDTLATVRMYGDAQTASIDAVKATETKLSFSPNPSSGLVNILYSTAQNKSSKVVVRDLTGRTIISQPLNGTQGTSSLDLSNQPAGIYLISMVSGNSTISTQKLILR